MQGAVFERHLHSRLPFPLMGAVDEFSGRGWCVFLGLGTFSFGSSMVFSWRYVPRLKGVDQGSSGGRGGGGCCARLTGVWKLYGSHGGKGRAVTRDINQEVCRNKILTVLEDRSSLGTQ